MQRKNKGLSMIIGVLLLCTVILGVAVAEYIALQNFSSATTSATKLEEERLQEKISLIALKTKEIGGLEYIDEITILNTGSIGVIIKSVYIDHNFIFDPSDPAINPNGAEINPNSTKNISFIGLSTPQPYEPNALMSISTAKGTSSSSYEKILVDDVVNIFTVQSNFGPLKLIFKDFWHAKYVGADLNNKDIIDEWEPGWQVGVESSDTEVVWNVSIKNIGSKDILIDNTSCFVLMSLADRANTLSWYLNSTSSILIQTGQTLDLVFKWVNPGGGGVEKIASPGSNPLQYKVFMVFFGTYTATGQPFAQTIPFQSVVVYRG